MVDIDVFNAMADEIVDDLPQEFFRKLNGGVLLIEESKQHVQSRPEAPLYIMGEYQVSSVGRSIVIYYGSFAQTYPNMPQDMLKDELRRTIFHEFRHHLEGISGRHELEIEDARRLEEYRKKHNV